MIKQSLYSALGVLSGCLVSMFLISTLLFDMWGFSVARDDHWAYLIDLFSAGWRLDTPREWLFVGLIVLTPPLVFLGGLLGGRLGRAVCRSAPAQGAAPTVPPAAPPARPGPRPNLPRAPYRPPPRPVGATAGATAPRAATPPRADAPRGASDAWREDCAEVLNWFSTQGFQVLVSGDGEAAPLHGAAWSGTRLVLFRVFAESGEWLADEEEFENEPPLWFAEKRHKPSPVSILRAALDRAADVIAEERLAPDDLDLRWLVVLTRGSIVNPEEMEPIWRDMAVTVARGPKAIDTELPPLADTVPADRDRAEDSAVIARLARRLGGDASED